MFPSAETRGAAAVAPAAAVTTGLALGIVSPMANEADTAVEFVDVMLGACAPYGFDPLTFFAVVDRASHDRTRALLESHACEEPRLHVVWAPETRGVADAYLRGYREALAAGCDWILEIDAGFSHDPNALDAFFAAMAAGRDCVFGSRFLAGGRNLGILRRRFVSRAGTVLANALLGTRLTDMTSGYELFNRAALEAVLAKGIRSRGPFFQTEIKASCRGLDVAEVPISYAGGDRGVGGQAIAESLTNLSHLFARRLRGTL